ncbi:hypothetical protein [Pelomonas sp. BJYL3]|uniref:hypothetical protein n=1 Tax=Pelomonas sp. BJYL3 TaxID=2976697 RepID=UPI0022B475C5|nr:hypothetical protein [Pelomonas sp. BJYL3]
MYERASNVGQPKDFGAWCLWVLRMSCALGLLVGFLSQLYPAMDLGVTRLLARMQAPLVQPPRQDAGFGEPPQQRAPLPPECPPGVEGPVPAQIRRFDAGQAAQAGTPAPSTWPISRQARLVEGIYRRQVDVEVQDRQVLITRTLWLGRCSPAMATLRELLSSKGLVAALEDERAQRRSRPQGMESIPATGIFGAVHLNSRSTEVRSAPVVEDYDPAGAAVRVAERSSIALDPTEGTSPKSYTLLLDFGDWPSGSDELTLRSEKPVSVWSRDGTALRQSSTQGHWKAKDFHILMLRVELGLEDAARPDTAAAPGNGKDDKRQARPFLQRALTGEIEAVRALWHGVQYAVPFFLVLLWARRRLPAEERGAAMVKATEKGCLLALSLIGVLAACDIVEALASSFHDVLRAHGFINLSWTASLLKAAIVGLVWPLLARSTPWVSSARGAGVALCVTALAFATLMLARGAGAEMSRGLEALLRSLERTGRWPEDLSQGTVTGLAYGLALLVGPLAALWATGRIWTGRPMAGALAVVLAWMGLSTFLRSSSQSVQLVASTALAMPFGWAFAGATRHWIPANSAWATRSVSAWGTALLVLLAAVMAIPPDFSSPWSVSWLMTEGTWELAHTWRWAAVALLLAWLHPRDPASASTLETGALLLFVGYFWQSLHVLPQLIGAAVGAVVIAFMLYTPRPLRRPGGSRRRLLGQAVREIGLYNRMLALRRGLQKGIQAKLDKADIEPADAVTKLEKMDQAVDAREAAATRKRCLTLLALNAGPGGSAWQRGRQGALLAGLIALPWITWYLRALKLGEGTTNAATWHVFALAIDDIARWPLLGFFFMYFYPRLRGHSGILKGIWMSSSVVLPAAVGTLAGAPDSLEGWSSVTLWALQAFVVCMLLGVVLGDYGALRVAGRRARGLIEIYNLGTLAAWTSSLAIAVGVATSSSIADQAAGFLKDRIAQIVAAAPAKAEAAKAPPPSK